MPKQNLSLQPKPPGRQAAFSIILYNIGVQSPPYPVAPAIYIFPCLLYGLAPSPFIPDISGFPTRNNQRWPVLAHVCPLGRPTQGGQTDARCPWQAYGNFSLAETTSDACPWPTSVLFCLPCRRLSDPPKPKYSYSPVLATSPFVQQSTFYIDLIPLRGSCTCIGLFSCKTNRLCPILANPASHHR